MKQRMREIVDNFHKYNSDHMAKLVFGFDEDIVYDALVVAPAFSPENIGIDKLCEVTLINSSKINESYILRANGKTIAWIKIGQSEGTLIDYLSICSELTVKKMIFIGSAGALKPEFDIGDICTPTYTIAGDNAHSYLKESIKDFVPFEKVTPPDMQFVDRIVAMEKGKNREIKKTSVFDTPVVSLEYSHLDEIKSFNTDLIEMETAAFYLLADLMENPSVALLIVSDNSSAGVALVGRTPEQTEKYYTSRYTILPEIVLDVIGM